MDSKEFREAGKQMIDYIADYFENVEKLRVIPDVKPGFLLNSLPSSAPQQGEDFAQIFADYQNYVLPGIAHFQSPNYHMFFPCRNSYPSILGVLLGTATGGVAFSWEVNPSYTELEIVVINWLGKMLDLPKEFLPMTPPQGVDGKRGGGVLQGSASESLLVTMLAAKRRALDCLKEEYSTEPEAVLIDKLVAYGSQQTHSSLEKAKLICSVKLRLIETDDQGIILPDLLLKAIEEDVKCGLYPFFYCGTLGTTVSCAYEPLDVLGPICQKWHMWFHVDAAFSGSLFVCPEYRTYLKGIEFADSFNFNCHKFLLTPFGCSPLWVKDREALMNALSVDRTYFKNNDTGVVTDFRKWQIPLGKPFRAMKLWFVLRSHGVEGLQRHVREYIERTELFQSLVEQDDRFEFWPRKPCLGLVCFRVKGPDKLTKMLADNINHQGKISVSAVVFKNKTIIRFHGGAGVEGQPADNNERHVRLAWKIIQNETESLIN